MALTKVSRGLLSTSIVDNGNATAITIDANENVGIGTSSPSAPIHVNRSGVGEAIRFTDSSTDTGHLEIVSGGGCSLWAGGFLAFGAGGGASYTERMRIDSSGNLILKKNLVLESTSEGIDFSGVGSSAQTLDDYEEGTWTPVLSGSGYSFGTHTGTYVKVGKVVTVSALLNITAVGSSTSTISLSGYPFVAHTATNQFQLGVVRQTSTSGALYVCQINVGLTVGGINSMDGVTSGSDKIFTTGNYGLSMTYIADS